MAELKCKNCGRKLVHTKDLPACTCQYCGTPHTFPKPSDEYSENPHKEMVYHHRSRGFDKTIGAYEQILNEDDCKAAMKYAEPAQTQIYQTEANEIDSVQKGIRPIAQQKKSGTSRGLIVTLVVLLLILAGSVGCLVYRKLDSSKVIMDNTQNNPTTNRNENTAGNMQSFSCRDITINIDEVVLGKAGDVHLISYNLQPENTTDIVSFSSENPGIAVVSDKGYITAIASGETVIYITCGGVRREIVVRCQFEQENSVPTAPVAPTTSTTPTTSATTPTIPTEDIRLNRKDITLSYKGEKWELYSGSVAKNLVKFSSDNESAVTFIDGYVTAVGASSVPVTVYAEYNGIKVSCVVRCSFKDPAGGTTGSGGVTEDGEITINKTGTVINVQEWLNVRTGPGTNYELAGKLYLGATVTVTEKRTDASGYAWYKTETGWVREDFIKFY